MLTVAITYLPEHSIAGGSHVGMEYVVKDAHFIMLFFHMIQPINIDKHSQTFLSRFLINSEVLPTCPPPPPFVFLRK